MRIIGGRDYYDSAMAYGQDKSVVFLRKETTIPVDETPLEWNYTNVYVTHQYEMYNGRIGRKSCGYFRNVIVYLAGKRYRGIHYAPDRFDFDKKAQTFWNLDKLNTFIDNTDFRLYEKKPRSYDGLLDHGPRTFKEYFENQGQPVSETELNWLIENRIVVALCCDDAPRAHHELPWWRCNTDELKDYKFQQVLDPYSAFQEISMFVGGVLPRNGNEMVEVSDKSLIAKHGFDKWSFRKQKEKM